MMKTKHSSSYWTLFFFLPALTLIIQTSCLRNAGVEYSSFIEIDDEGMPENWEYVFNPVPADSTSFSSVDYDVILVIRYISSAKPGKILLDVEEISLMDDKPDSTVVAIPLFNQKDEPLGKGNYSVYEIADTLRKKVRIPENYSISISSPLPQGETQGIKSVGIVLSRSGAAKEFNLIGL